MTSEHVAGLVAAACTRWSVPGAAVGLLRGAQRSIVTVGVVAAAGTEAVAPTTSFHLGSIAKSLTAALVVDAAARGELDLDVPCDAQAAGTWDDTPRALMAHTSGRPNVLPEADEDLVAFVARIGELPRTHAAGRFSYCNAGWSVLDLLLRCRCGGSFEELAAERCLGPAATFGAPDGGAVGHAVDVDDHVVAVRPHDTPAASAAGARWWATCDQALDYAALHLRGADPSGGSALDAAALTELRTPHVPIPGATVADAWGLGWAIWDRGPHRSFGWVGYTAGQRAFLRCFPEQDAAVVVLTNGAGPLLRAPGGSALIDDLLPALLAEIGVPPPSAPQRGDAPIRAEQLAGRFGPIELDAAGADHLILHAEAFGESAPITVVRIGGNTFAPEEEPAGSMAIAFDDDLLYVGPFAFRRS